MVLPNADDSDQDRGECQIVLTALEYPLPALPSEELLNLLSLVEAGGDHADPLSEGISTLHTTVSHINTQLYTITTLMHGPLLVPFTWKIRNYLSRKYLITYNKLFCTKIILIYLPSCRQIFN